MIYFFILISVQIILESFPVSSSGHIILLENFFEVFSLGSSSAISSNRMLSHFLHGPTAIVLAAFFFDRWMFLVRHIKTCWPYVLKIIGFAFLADIVTFLIFLIFNHVVDVSFFPIGVGFLISLAFLLSLRFCNREKYGSITVKKALLLGAVQGLSLLPGVSRFGTTFVAGCWLGLSPKKSFEFSFVILWPLVFIGFSKSLVKFFSVNFVVEKIYLLDFNILLCIVISSAISFFALHFVKILALTNRLWWFSLFLIFSFISWLVFVLWV